MKDDFEFDPPSFEEDKIRDDNVYSNIKINKSTDKNKLKVNDNDIIKNFEKKLKKDFEYNINEANDSDYEEDLFHEEFKIDDPMLDKRQVINKYKILQIKLIEKNKQLDQLRFTLEDNKQKNDSFIDLISKNTNTELKDKKIIELTRKNQDLNLRIEKFRLRIKDLEKKTTENKENDTKIEQKEVKLPQIEENQTQSIIEVKKKLKITEQKLSETINKLQLSKEENTKLNILIKREIGEMDLDKALKDKNYWRGKSETIELLKSKIKTLETQLQSDVQINGDGDKSLSNISRLNSNNINYSEYKKEKEQFKNEIDKLKDENIRITNEYNRIKTRKDGLEKDIKQQKEDLTGKIRILLEKNDNDEKLIEALTKELEKRGSSIAKNISRENIFNLQQEIIKLRNDLKEKDNLMKDIQSSLLIDNNSKFNSQSLTMILKKMKDLENENKRLKNESDEGSISDQIARENVKLRIRIKELEDKLLKD